MKKERVVFKLSEPEVKMHPANDRSENGTFAYVGIFIFNLEAGVLLPTLYSIVMLRINYLFGIGVPVDLISLTLIEIISLFIRNPVKVNQNSP
jgi:hypothetical protein